MVNGGAVVVELCQQSFDVVEGGLILYFLVSIAASSFNLPAFVTVVAG